MSHYDCLGVEILASDTVMVNSWGDGARLVDCGARSPVLKFGRTRVTINDVDGFPRAVAPDDINSFEVLWTLDAGEGSNDD